MSYIAVYAARAEGNYRLLKVTTCDAAKEIADAAINKKHFVKVVGIIATKIVGSVPYKMTRSHMNLIEEGIVDGL